MVVTAACVVPSHALTLFQTDFNTDTTADWTVNTGPTDESADFFFDYSSVGIPAAPNGSGTRGLKMTSNVTDGIFGGFSVSPTGAAFSGNYKVEFDLWQNYGGPLGPGGNGTTQLSLFGLGTSGTTTFWPGSTPKESVSFAVSLDGGSNADYRAYSSAAPTSYPSGATVYSAPAGALNNSNAYYTSAFAPNSAPVDQVSLFPGQTGSTDPGEVSFTWRRVTLEVASGFATWSIDSLPIAVIDLSTVTLGGNNILFGHSDSNATSSTDVNSALLNFTLIDNISVTSGSLDGDYNADNVVDAADYTVWRDGNSPDDSPAGYALWATNYGSTGVSLSTAVPEPSTLMTLGAAVLALAGRRRR